MHISPFQADQPGADPEFTMMRVDTLRISDMVDLEGDEFADSDPTYTSSSRSFADLSSSWEFEYGAVVGIERETPTCIRIDFHNGESVGFPPDHLVLAHRLTEQEL